MLVAGTKRFYIASMGEACLRYVKDKGAVVHIWDYLKDRQDHALCGHPYIEPTDLDERPSVPRRLCRKCRALIPRAESIRFREDADNYAQYARDLQVEYDRLRREYEVLWSSYEWWITHSKYQREEIANLIRTWRPKKWDDRPPPPPRQRSAGTRGSFNPGQRPPSGQPRTTPRSSP